jgi:hypothetical protein
MLSTNLIFSHVNVEKLSSTRSPTDYNILRALGVELPADCDLCTACDIPHTFFIAFEGVERLNAAFHIL